MEQNADIYFTIFTYPQSSNIWKASLNLATHTLIPQSIKQLTFPPEHNNEVIHNNPSILINPPETKILYYSNKDNSKNNHIYLQTRLNQQTTTLQQLTEGEQNNYDPIFRKKSESIFYKSNRFNGLGNIWHMRITNKPYQHNNITKDIEGEQWKPEIGEQNQLYFTNNINDNAQIWKYDLEKQMGIKLTNNKVPDWYPTYDANHKKIYFISRNAQSTSDHIFSMNSDGSQREQMTTFQGDSSDPSFISSCTHPGHPSLHNKLLFINNKSGYYQLYIMDALTRKITPIKCKKFQNQNILSPTLATYIE